MRTHAILGHAAATAFLVAIALTHSKAAYCEGFVNVQIVCAAMAVRALAHDQHGLVWSASDRGICRFDGKELLCPVDKPVATLRTDESYVWAGMADGVVLQIRGLVPRIWAHVQGQITSLVSSRSGVWVASTGALTFFDLLKPNQAPVQVWPEATLHLAKRGVDGVFAAVGKKLLSVGPGGPATALFTFDDNVTALTSAPPWHALIIGCANGSIYQAANGALTTLHLPKQDRASVRSLTEREIEILEQISAGLTNKQVCSQLGISEKIINATSRCDSSF